MVIAGNGYERVPKRNYLAGESEKPKAHRDLYVDKSQKHLSRKQKKFKSGLEERGI